MARDRPKDGSGTGYRDLAGTFGAQSQDLPMPNAVPSHQAAATHAISLSSYWTAAIRCTYDARNVQYYKFLWMHDPQDTRMSLALGEAMACCATEKIFLFRMVHV